MSASCFLAIAFFASSAIANATESFVPYYTSEDAAGPIDAAKAAGITNGITLGQVVAKLGMGTVHPLSGCAIIHWRFSDGRDLSVFPSGFEPGTVLTSRASADPAALQNVASSFWFTPYLLPKEKVAVRHLPVRITSEGGKGIIQVYFSDGRTERLVSSTVLLTTAGGTNATPRFQVTTNSNARSVSPK